MNRTPDFVYESRTAQLALHNPTAVYTAHTIDEVKQVLESAQACVARGQVAAGYIAYEAAPAFDSALQCHPPGDLPLVWIGVFDAVAPNAPVAKDAFRFGAWQPSITEAEYHAALTSIRHWIGAGDTYQVNYTYPWDATFEGDPYAAYTALRDAQDGGHTAFVDAGSFQVVSASPELFFRLENNVITSRPMKGTRPRGLWSDHDLSLADDLRNSAKDHAENVMIVDMIRNDLGRIAEPGTVSVENLFAVEQYATVWQMTSAVQAHTRRSVPEILAAMFPCASVTGAPKVQTMRYIRELEPAPRGVYCGAMGWWTPDGTAEFNVAIRTMTLDRARGTARYHVGSGVTWDSIPDDEFDECGVKAAILNYTTPEFSLLESLLYDGEFFLLDGHLKRLAASARYFNIPIDADALRENLLQRAQSWEHAPQKVRLLVNHSGTLLVEREPIAPTPIIKLGLATSCVNSRDRFLYHKTTHRDVYDRALATRPDCDDVVLVNERGELTESTRANLVVQLGDVRYTPPVECGLLSGVMRDQLLDAHKIVERVLTPPDLENADGIWLINSVRKWIDVDYTGARTEDLAQPAPADAP